MDLFGNKPIETIRALSWKQPYGSAMLYGKIETRRWQTNYRGKVLICTSKAAYNGDAVRKISGSRQYKRLCNALIDDIPEYDYKPSTLDLNGYAIAVGDLVGCRRMSPEDEAKTFVKFRPELWCHIYENVRAIKPFKWRGAQKWKKVDEVTARKITYRIE